MEVASPDDQREREAGRAAVFSRSNNRQKDRHRLSPPARKLLQYLPNPAPQAGGRVSPPGGGGRTELGLTLPKAKLPLQSCGQRAEGWVAGSLGAPGQQDGGGRKAQLLTKPLCVPGGARATANLEPHGFSPPSQVREG